MGSLVSCDSSETELGEFNQKGCLIYSQDEELFNGVIITRHENGEVSQRIQVENGKIKGEFTTYDYSGGLLSQGETFESDYDNIHDKKWVEGPMGDKNSVKFCTPANARRTN